MNAAYLVRRFLVFVPTITGAVTLVFIVIRLAPGSPIDIILGDFKDVTPRETVARIVASYGLDQPLHVQYARYVERALRGDLGFSLMNDRPVLQVLAPHLRPTLMLAFAGLLVAVAIGVPAGVAAALRRNTGTDYGVMTFAVLWLSAPSFWLSILLVYVFGYLVPVLPMFGGGTTGDLPSELRYLVLPAIAIGSRSAALLARMSRSSTLEIMAQDFVRTARAKGLAGRVVVYKHALRNAAMPIVTVIGLDLAYLVGGTVVIETVFARPGLGKTLIDAINNRDYPVVQGCILVFALGIIVVNFLTDVAYALLDPRVRFD
ncbi:MAG: ABC transporter permease [Armatimonadetes bacterium]|nr:ABC transporter permease [Armatimonadota bacterium]